MAKCKPVPPLSARDRARFWSKVEKTADCWLWTAYTKARGYGQFRLGKRAVGAHRISWALANGPIPPGLHVLHRCPGGSRSGCVRPSHLHVGTHRDNMADKMREGRHAPTWGELNGMARVDGARVRRIRRLYATGRLTQQDLADEFGISKRQVGKIVRREQWKHLAQVSAPGGER